MTNETKLVRRDDIYAADMNGQTVMMDPGAGKYYNIGEIGGRIWELLEQPATVGELIAALTKEYDVDEKQCAEDTVPFLESLVKKGLITEEK